MTRGAVKRIAMWSGPRNLSTALMYSFGNRPDCAALDEPFYAYSLRAAGNDHPMRDAILRSNDDDYDRVVAACLGPLPVGKTVFYQKHMTHHMAPGCDLGWTAQVQNAFLIRRPERVLASYVKKWADVGLRDIGFVEQAQIFDRAAQRLGSAPPVIDADDLLADPEGALTALCAALHLPFDLAMLSWPTGPKPFDGIWASHWYDAAWRSSGFAPPAPAPAALPAPLQDVADAATPYYEQLATCRIASRRRSG